MENYDPEKAARVWQRVRGSAEVADPATPGTQGLLPLIAQAWNSATTYLHLSRRFQGSQSAMLRRMAEQEQTHAACLKGIYVLTTGSHPVNQAVPSAQESPETTLRRCYTQEMRSMKEYEARSSDPEYGQIFARLADQEREHCRQILALLGSLPPTRKTPY